MYPKNYKDYPEDVSLVQEKVEPSRGIVGVEMHERNGWGETDHRFRRKKGMFTRIFAYFFGTEKELS